ncbi:histidine phosphatase family protein [Roseovarius autotrophicus]|uniref:histidine phosphatase family protein n=1 Tax=Roseovarius autotrophicus TaxID=2824121 RepID=UPI0019EC7400|nr:histidine phosphatase family protein [Roseovarius autotrophicus]MBE0452751.1 histidine phosphatase family protein [Roseovarius sp.]
MSRFFWVRHGPTHARAMVGWSDIPADLSDGARLSRLSAHLPEGALVVSSDLIRARATAVAIAGARPRLPDDPDLREIHFGDWEMQGFDSVSDPEHLRTFWEQPGALRAPGGESWDDLSARVGRAVARLRAMHPGRDIVAVAHMGTILTQVQAARGVSAYEALGQTIDNLSVTELHWQAGGWRTEVINLIP